MNDVVLFHIMEGDQYLDSESSDQPNGNTLEVIALDELVKVHTKYFEWKNKMLSENKLLVYPNNILLVVLVTIAKLL